MKTIINICLLSFFSISTFAFEMNTQVESRPCHDLNDYGEKCLSESDFNEVIDAVISNFSSAFEKHGWRLSADKQWSSDIENATYNWVSSN